jgi:hypothetical protein
MYFISATRLKISSIRYLPQFMFANKASAKQLRITPGFMEGKELMDKGLIFWTMTLWERDADMKSFRNSPPHRKAMQMLPVWCNEATFTHWLQEEPVLPAWNLIHERIIKEGIITKVRNATVRHLSKKFQPVKWTKLVRELKPLPVSLNEKGTIKDIH